MSPNAAKLVGVLTTSWKHWP